VGNQGTELPFWHPVLSNLNPLTKSVQDEQEKKGFNTNFIRQNIYGMHFADSLYGYMFVVTVNECIEVHK
jgi:hypothetical protein